MEIKGGAAEFTLPDGSDDAGREEHDINRDTVCEHVGTWACWRAQRWTGSVLLGWQGLSLS